MNSEQKSWFLKVVCVSSSAGNSGNNSIVSLKIKSYYQTWPFWLCYVAKNMSLFNNPDLSYVSRSARNPGCHWKMGLNIKSYYQTLLFYWKLNQEKAVLFSKSGSLFSNSDQFTLWIDQSY